MKKILILLCVLTNTLFSNQFKFNDFEKNGIRYVWDQPELYEKGLTVYLEAFRTLYTALNVENRESHFQETMKHELELVKAHPKEIHWLVAMKGDRSVGLSIYEFYTYPDIYVREVAVLPEYQRKGIGRELTFAPLRDLSDVRKVAIVTRKVNKPAIAFYESLGFHTSDFSHSEYDPHKYIGMEWIKK